MINCDRCDYFNEQSEVKGETMKCVFSNYVFKQHPEELDIEYPCKNISYTDYLNRINHIKSANNDIYSDWKLVYTRLHFKVAKESRYTIS